MKRFNKRMVDQWQILFLERSLLTLNKLHIKNITPSFHDAAYSAKQRKSKIVIKYSEIRSSGGRYVEISRRLR